MVYWRDKPGGNEIKHVSSASRPLARGAQGDFEVGLLVHA
jgi:hypothetical protein